jgi:hypothetical protein
MIDVAIVFSAVNSILLLILLYVFAGIAIRSRASHSVGLMFFALLLLANSILTAFSYATMSPFFCHYALPYLSTMSVQEFVGLAVLLKITL